VLSVMKEGRVLHPWLIRVSGRGSASRPIRMAGGGRRHVWCPPPARGTSGFGSALCDLLWAQGPLEDARTSPKLEMVSVRRRGEGGCGSRRDPGSQRQIWSVRQSPPLAPPRCVPYGRSCGRRPVLSPCGDLGPRRSPLSLRARSPASPRSAVPAEVAGGSRVAAGSVREERGPWGPRPLGEDLSALHFPGVAKRRLTCRTRSLRPALLSAGNKSLDFPCPHVAHRTGRRCTRAWAWGSVEGETRGPF
jgi:hypothetical protein